MISQLYFLKFNNYANRRYKPLNSLTEVNQYTNYTSSYNFNPGDGVSAQVVVGLKDKPYIYTCDYVVEVVAGAIKSRWFIMESHFNREGQCILNLYRDIVADFYDSILNADTFIEKATLLDSSPFIYNKENISVNQIKKSETKIKDESGCPWIVGYLDRKYEGETIPIVSTDVVPDYTVSSLSDWTYHKYIGVSCYGERTKTSFNFEMLLLTEGNVYKFANYKDWIGEANTNHDTSYAFTTNFVVNPLYLNAFIEKYKDEINTNVTTYSGLYETVTLNKADYDSILSQEGKIIYVSGTNTYYKIHATITANSRIKQNITTDKQGDKLQTYLNGLFSKIKKAGSDNPAYQIEFAYRTARLSVEEITVGTTVTNEIVFPGPTKRLHVKDAPLDMFCIPYKDCTIKNSAKTGFTQFTMTAASALSVATSLASKLGATLYDLQLLPFSPLTGLKYSSGVIDINSSDEKRYTIVDNAIPLIWCTASSGSKTITNISFNYTNKKIDNETKFLRFVSPGYSSSFEINPAKLDHGFSAINVDYTYLPYNPFIRVAPLFSGLYGSEFHDSRGLILSGDFSLMYLGDAWVNFQTQNKNYDLIFNREIKNLETQHGIANQNALVGSVVGTLQGAVTGGTIGSIGGPIGSIVGAVAGGIASGVAGAADIANTKKLQAEAIDFKRDLFGYQLGNIKAMPNSVAKTTAYNIINKLFPVIEVYECTEEEKKAVANKIAWNGMTVMAIGRIFDYIPNTWSYGDITDKGYIKGQIIRLNDDKIDDANLQATIIEEINKGWYFK